MPLRRKLLPVRWFDVVPCDSTQSTAIAEARRGESFIIQGPPGTRNFQMIRIPRRPISQHLQALSSGNAAC